MPAQPPVETPPLNTTTTTTTTPTPPPTTPPPSGDIISQITGFFTSPLNIIMIVAGVLGVVGLLVLILKAVQALHAHPLSKKLSSWLTSPGVDAIIIGLDPHTRECTLIPGKKVGSLYVGIEDGSFIAPVGGGETYVLKDSGKTVLIALVHHGNGVQANPALEQVLSLSLTPITGKEEEPPTLKDLRRTLISYIQNESATITGEIYISPRAKLYLSARAPRVLELLRKEIAYANDATLVATAASIRTIREEGAKIAAMREQLAISKRTATLMAIAIIALIIGVVLAILKMAHVF